MANIRKTSMTTQVYDVIKEKILSQEYDLGQPINITAISKELDVSNTPVREALMRLETEGLVTSDLNKKVRVIDIDDAFKKEVDYFFFTLYSGSYMTCRLQGRIPALIDLMEEAMARQVDTLKTKDYPAFTQAAIAFDRCFVAATENQRLLTYHDQVSPILNLLTRYEHQKAAPNREAKLRQHQQILEAVKTGDADSVITVLYNHYDQRL